MDSTEAERRLLWENAHAMSRAHFVFAPDDLRTRLQELEQTTNVQSFLKDLHHAADSPDVPAPGPGRLDFLLRQMTESPHVQRGEEARKLKDRLRAGVLHHLRCGDLLSFGFEPRNNVPGALRSIGDVPIELGYDHWRGRVSWESDELHANGLHFVQVRILSAARAEKLRQDRVAKIAQEIPTPKIGRPSATKDIVAACEALIAAGKIDTNASIRSQIPIVRAWRSENRPGAAHIGDETIRRVLSPLLRELEKKQKLETQKSK